MGYFLTSELLWDRPWTIDLMGAAYALCAYGLRKVRVTTRTYSLWRVSQHAPTARLRPGYGKAIRPGRVDDLLYKLNFFPCLATPFCG